MAPLLLKATHHPPQELIMTLLHRFALAAATALFTTTASAAVVNFSGTLSGTDPVFNRPVSNASTLSGVGTSVYHDVYAFFVTVGGSYTLQTTSASFTNGTPDDTFLVLYQPTFNSASPLANALEADDDDGLNGLSLITRTLEADTQYYLVVTSFGNGQTGNYAGTISNDGSGTAVLGTVNAVPLPGTLALAGLGLVGLAASRRKRAA
jgi:PEP-CTERM motif